MTTLKDRIVSLWNEYKPYYLQHQDGVNSAAIHVLEHAVKEVRLYDSENDGSLKEDTITEGRDMAVTVIQELIEDGKVPINNISSQVQCDRCKKFAKGVIRTVNLPNGEIYEHERVCYVCAT